MPLRTLHLTLCLLSCLVLSCGVPAPTIEEGYLPSDTSDALGPYLVIVKTWGATDRVRLEWRLGENEDAPLDSTEMVEVAADTWEGELPGMMPGSTVEVRVVADGPGGTARFPARGAHRFTILNGESGCGGGPACEAGLQCIDGRCERPAECTTDETCEEGFVCVGGACTPVPPCNGRCGPREVCVDDVCQALPDCTTNEDCPDTFICAESVCVPAPGICDMILCETGTYCDEETGDCIECRTDDECGPNGVCLGSFCAESECGDDLAEPNNGPDQARELPPETVIEGSTCEQDPDFFSVVDAQQRLFMEILSGEVLIFVTDESGDPIEERFYSFGESLTLLVEPGWLILVVGASGEPADYLLGTQLDDSAECIDDRFEDNDRRDDASRLGATGAYIAGASCPDDDDWFRFRRRRRDEPTQIVVKGDRGRLEGILEDPDGEQVAAFGPELDTVGYRSLVYNGNERDIFLRLRCPECPGGLNYTLATRSLGSECRDDILEPNDRAEQATPIPGNSGFEQSGLVVCADRGDYFLIEHEEGRPQRVSVNFTNARGDIDLWIRDANGRLVGAALGAENGHSITMGADEPSGRYIVEVQLFTAGQATYDLAVDGG